MGFAKPVIAYLLFWNDLSGFSGLIEAFFSWLGKMNPLFYCR